MTTTAAPTSPSLRDESQSFWQIAGKAFSARRMNILACLFIACIAFMAVFVPFIANGHPFTIQVKNTDGQWMRHWPLFRNLTSLDLALFVAFAALVAYAFIFRRLAKKHADRESRSEARWHWAIILLGITVVCATALFIFRPTRLDPNDYRSYEAMIQNGTAQGAIFAPIHWSSAEQEPLISNRTYEYPSWWPWVAPHFGIKPERPTVGSWDHLLGTDGIGRDALSRLLWSSRIVMGIGFIAESIALVIGIFVGALMGYFSRKVDLFGMRLVEIFESIPTFILILIFVATYGRNIFMIMAILGITGWTGIARFTRAEFLRLRNLDYVQAAKASGLPLHRILFRHMLPNGLTPVIVTVTFGIAGAVMSESGLSFLGVGVEPPTPSWGSLLNEAGNPAETFRWWLAIAPGLLIFLTVFAYNTIGEGLRDAIDPRTNRVR